MWFYDESIYKLYECDREILQELIGFVDTIIKREIEKGVH
nr:MAG TPA: hypothetical protein [Caudoviricetes sp.]